MRVCRLSDIVDPVDPVDADVRRSQQHVVLDGEWDIARRDELRELLAAAVAATERDMRLVLDLRAVEFVDSSALSIFLNAHRRLTRCGATMMTLCRPGSIVARAIGVTNLTDTLNVLETD